MEKDTFWQEFIKTTGRDTTTKYNDCFHFDLTEEYANKLLNRVLSGKKRAISTSLAALEKSNVKKIPQVGDLNIVTDWDGNPQCVIETTAVIILPFGRMTGDICRREEEGYKLESWQKVHRQIFSEEGKEMGYKFNEAMPVVFEDFKVVYSKQ